MGFNLTDHWVWDFWLADDGEQHHLFYLHAPKSLGHPDLRHRNAKIGHATSTDLRSWTNHGRAFEPGLPGSFDGSATWTGSVVKAAVEQTVDTLGGLHITVHTVAIHPYGSATETSEATWDRVMAVNLKSVFLLAHHAVPHMVAQRDGAILSLIRRGTKTFEEILSGLPTKPAHLSADDFRLLVKRSLKVKKL